MIGGEELEIASTEDSSKKFCYKREEEERGYKEGWWRFYFVVKIGKPWVGLNAYGRNLVEKKEVENTGDEKES